MTEKKDHSASPDAPAPDAPASPDSPAPSSPTAPTSPAVPPPSAYPVTPERDRTIKDYTIAVLVDNEPGVLARVVGLFSGRGYNIDSLTVSEVNHKEHMSRMTIITNGTRQKIEQIKLQLTRLVSVSEVLDLTETTSKAQKGRPISREVMLLKCAVTQETKPRLMELAKTYGAKILRDVEGALVVELTGRSDKIEMFLKDAKSFEVLDFARTGIGAIADV